MARIQPADDFDEAFATGADGTARPRRQSLETVIQALLVGRDHQARIGDLPLYGVQPNAVLGEPRAHR